MGDYWNDSGWYERQQESYAREQVRRDQERDDMRFRQDELMRQIQGERNEEDARRRQQNNIGAGSSVSSRSSSISEGPVSRFLSKPLIQIGNSPALLTRGIFITLPLSIAVIYYCRSIAPWMPTVIVSVLLLSTSPLLTKIVGILFRIAIVIAIILVLIIIAGFVFHWWHFTPVQPIHAPKH